MAGTALTYEQASAAVTAPGQIFEVVPLRVDGVEYSAFKNAPGTLAEIFAMARAYGERTFLVYEDER